MNKVNLQNIPTSPGVYLHKNIRGEVIYVGKAKNLKKRVSSYFSSSEKDPKTTVLVKNIFTTDFIATNNELEALLLENRLIKKYRPKYNIDLKDSVRYYYIQVTKEDFPRVLVTRKTNKKDRFFGPYTIAMYDLVKMVRTLFNLRACNSGGHNRACLYYQIGMCSGPCGGKITKKDYAKNVDEAIKFLKHGSVEVLEKLHSSMLEASKKQGYEQALGCKKKIQLLEQIMQRQLVDTRYDRDQDAIGVATSGDKSCISILKLKKGVILHKLNFVFLASEDLVNEFLKVYYTNNPAPSEIVIEGEFDPSIQKYLSNHWNRVIKIIKPLKGKKLDLVKLARKNAYLHFNLEDPVLIELKELLDLSEAPRVIDCFDISNYGESVVVGACVQFKDKAPNKSQWRHYNIKGNFGQDDFRSIKEVVKRRYLKQKLPNLIIIDGGKVQVDFALQALQALGLSCSVVGLAKREETIVFPDGHGLVLNRKLDAFKFVIKIRDSVHNFAIAHSRSRFKKKYKESELDLIPGIGEKTKFLLLREFGSLDGIKKASSEAIMNLLGNRRGMVVYEFFSGE